MSKFVGVLAMVAGLALGVLPAAAQFASVEGNWATGPKDYKYRVYLCGAGGEELCATMTFGNDPSPEVQSYVGKEIITAAKKIGPNSWKGNLFMLGHRMHGTMTLVSDNEMQFDACAMLVICGKFSMFREGTN